jgi:hypothetical protein
MSRMPTILLQRVEGRSISCPRESFGPILYLAEMPVLDSNLIDPRKMHGEKVDGTHRLIWKYLSKQYQE